MIEPQVRMTVWFWGYLGGSDLVAIEVQADEGRIQKLQMNTIDLQGLVKHPSLNLDYRKVWNGLAGFFDVLVKRREVVLENAKHDQSTVCFETKLLRNLLPE